MLPAQEAEQIILDLLIPLDSQKDTEIVDLKSARGRILARSISSKLDFPYWDNSAMDGYAVRYEDVKQASFSTPVTLEIIEEIPAGSVPRKTISSQQTSRIFTGAMLPEGADTIVIQENTQRNGNLVTIFSAPAPQQYIRYRGSFYRAGEPMIESGIALDAPDIAVLATAQCSELTVYRRPKIAILSTGDELVTPESPLKPGQIVDSNQYALGSFVAGNGATPLFLGIVPDQPVKLKQVIQQAIAQADIVLSTGGVSVGDYDYIDGILEELGGQIQIRSVAVKPGKPLTVANFNNSCLYFGIPGNPVSALVSCWRFVQPAIKKLSGLKNNWQPTFMNAVAKQELRSAGKRETYLWGNLNIVDGNPEFSLAGGSHSSGNLINLSQTNALAMMPIGQTSIATGESIKVMLTKKFGVA